MRLSRHNMYMEMAKIVALRGTCPRLCVGAIAVSTGRRLFIGYNGAPSGDPHCIDVGCMVVGNSCVRTDHAEVNAISQIDDSISGKDLTLYVTHSPCQGCANLIASRKIKYVYFETPYRDTSPLLYLLAEGVEVYRLMPNGYVLDATGVRLA